MSNNGESGSVGGSAFDLVDLPDIEEVSVEEQSPRLDDDVTNYAVRFGIIGAGQGGGRIASTFWDLGHRRVVLVNTTEADFRGQSGSTKVVLPTESGASGAGKNPSVAREAVSRNGELVRDAIRDYIGHDVDRILITVGGGGGTGTGSAVGLVKIAQQFMKDNGKNPRSVGLIVSKPKASEGEQVQENFRGLIEDLKALEDVSPLVVVDNELINKRFPHAGVAQFWKLANSNLCGLFDIFNILASNVSQFVSFDKADYESVLSSGNLVFGLAKIPEFTSTSALCDALRSNVKKNLLGDEFDLSTATHAAGILVADQETLNDLPQAALDEAFLTLNRVLGNKVTLHQGVYPGNKPGIHLYTLVGGMKK